MTDSPMHGWQTVIGVLLGVLAGGIFAHYSWVIRQMMTQGISRNATMGTLFAGAIPILALISILFARNLPDHPGNLALHTCGGSRVSPPPMRSIRRR